MLAKDNEYMDEAAQTLYNYNSDALIREKCHNREIQLFFERSNQAKIKELSEKNAKLTDEITTLKAEIALLKALFFELHPRRPLPKRAAQLIFCIP